MTIIYDVELQVLSSTEERERTVLYSQEGDVLGILVKITITSEVV